MSTQRVVIAPASAPKPRVLLVGGGPFQLEILRAAQRSAEVVVVDGSPLAPGLALADHAHVVDIADVAAVVRLAKELCVSGVVTAASDVAVPAVSAVVRELQLPGLSSEAALRCRDKLACFRALRTKGYRVPETRAINDLQEAERAIAEVAGYPVIVKPRSGGGGRGVTLVRDHTQLPRAIACARRAYGPGVNGVLVQEFIGGAPLGVEAFFSNAELIEAFVLDDQFESSYVSPAGHALPTTLPVERAQQVAQAVAGFGRALGLRDGPANFDLRQVGDCTILLEVNPRLGGNSITDLVRMAHGVDLAEATVCAALGHDPRPLLVRKHNTPIAARLVLKHACGTARLHAPETGVRDHPDVITLDLMVTEGQPAHVRVDEWTIVGRVLVRGADTHDAAAFAERIASSVAERITLIPDR